MHGRIPFGVINNAVISKNPDGNVKLAWDRLVAKYAPQTMTKYMRLEKEFTTVVSGVNIPTQASS